MESSPVASGFIIAIGTNTTVRSENTGNPFLPTHFSESNRNESSRFCGNIGVLLLTIVVRSFVDRRRRQTAPWPCSLMWNGGNEYPARRRGDESGRQVLRAVRQKGPRTLYKLPSKSFCAAMADFQEESRRDRDTNETRWTLRTLALR